MAKSDEPTNLKAELEKLGGTVQKSLKALAAPYYLSTGLFAMDRVISSKGGLPGGICAEIFGPNSTGKTSLALQFAGNAQKRNMKVYYINAERAINDSIVQCFPLLDPEKVDWVTPDNGEAAIDIMTHLLRTEPNIFVINDSIPACLPANIEDGAAGDDTVGALARLFAKFMPKAKKYAGLNGSILLQLNQERAKIGPMVKGGKEQPGGNSVKFYSDVRMEITKRFPSPDIKVGEDVIGHYVAVKIVKTRFGIPYQIAELPIIYGRGFDAGREVAEFAMSFNLIEKKGAWYSYYAEGVDKDKAEPAFKFQGLEQVASYIRQNPAIRTELENRLKAMLS